jgi:hypothetical protein
MWVFFFFRLDLQADTRKRTKQQTGARITRKATGPRRRLHSFRIRLSATHPLWRLSKCGCLSFFRLDLQTDTRKRTKQQTGPRITRKATGQRRRLHSFRRRLSATHPLWRLSKCGCFSFLDWICRQTHESAQNNKLAQGSPGRLPYEEGDCIASEYVYQSHTRFGDSPKVGVLLMSPRVLENTNPARSTMTIRTG